MSHTCPIDGQPIHDTATICAGCGDTMRDNLTRIADRWAELEDALSWREDTPSVRGGRVKNGMKSVGTVLNEQASTARRTATDTVWFAVQVLRSELDDAGRAFNPPPHPAGHESTPTLARWLARWHVPHFTHKSDEETAVEIANDLAEAERQVYRATHPSGVHWRPVNLTCDRHGTSDTGQRTPCPGTMWAQVGRDMMPDLVCDADPTHVIAPGVWERAGWKRKTARHLVRKYAGA